MASACDPALLTEVEFGLLRCFRLFVARLVALSTVVLPLSINISIKIDLRPATGDPRAAWALCLCPASLIPFDKWIASGLQTSQPLKGFCQQCVVWKRPKQENQP